jgi:hypothetical protein
MITKTSVCRLSLCMSLLAPTSAWSAHPLVTDDTGTQGKNNFQLEVNGQYDHDKEAGITTTGGQAAAAMSYGITDGIDLIASVPYLWIREKSDLATSSEQSFSDVTLDIKLRLYQENGLSFAIKPGFSFPTGDDDKGLGSGKLGYHLFLIGTKEAGPLAFNANLGYIRNETDDDMAEKNIWHASVSAIFTLNDHWKLGADIVAERNSDKDGDNDPVSAIFGVIFSPTKDIDLDLGFKKGITSSDTDWSLLAGTTFRF